jgi:lysophospholipase L1-like esterase
LERNPLISRNLAGNGYTARQIYSQVKSGLKDKPRFILIMAGTNDILQEDFNLGNSIKEFEKIFNLFADRKPVPIITLVPFTNKKLLNQKIYLLNLKIKSLATSKGISIIDLNPYIAPSEYLTSQYTVDGVHLSEDAYKVWDKEIRKHLRGNRAD